MSWRTASEGNLTEADVAKEAPAIEVSHLTAGYGRHKALEDVTFTVEHGCLAGLVGPNGSGKSTLIKVIMGLHRPWGGEIRLSARSGPGKRPMIAYAPQSEMVDWSFPVTVSDVVMMGRYGGIGLLRRPSPEDRAAAMSSLDRVDMTKLKDRQIGELSGGQQRRVLIARALAREADLILLDEPVAGLDAAAQHDLLRLLEDLRKENRTLFVATHDLSCVASDFDHAVLLNKKVVAFGRPRDVFIPDLLSEAFQRHLLVLPGGERTLVS
jgi:ABC-type Mn2+/Zn2+ transport system ATPase subunit